MLSSNWLNEFRFGWSSIKFLMTPIDYGTNPAQAVGLPGINLNSVTSAMTQLGFQNIRNLGANSNQPLITNQNDFQIFDSVTRSTGRHTMKFGGSLTLRSREILNADTIVGNFSFNNMTSNCAGQPAGCTVNSATGFDVASFMLGLVSAKNRNLFDAGPTRKSVRKSRCISRTTSASLELTVNMGLRYDIYPPWTEIEDRQSNFDVTTGKFVVASDDAVIEVKVGRYLQTYSKNVGPRFGFAYDLDGRGRNLVRGGFGVFWNFSPGGTSSSKAQNPPFLQSTSLNPTPTAYGSNLLLSTGVAAPPGVDPNRAPAGATRSIFDIDFRDAYARQWNVNYQRSLGTNYMAEVAYVGSQGRQMVIKVDINQAPPVVGVSDANVNRPFIGLAPAVRGLSQSQSIGKVDYNGLLLKFQRRFANNFSFLNSYVRQVDGLRVGQRGGHHQQRSPVQLGTVGLRRAPLSSSWIYELPWARTTTAAGSWAASFTGAAVCR